MKICIVLSSVTVEISKWTIVFMDGEKKVAVVMVEFEHDSFARRIMMKICMPPQVEVDQYHDPGRECANDRCHMED
jgi:hypothetical protein